MTDLLDLTVSDYKAILSPFLMMTTCATLVWALQSRFSRLVHAIRTLTYEGKRDNIDYRHSLEKQISWLRGRSLLLRNSIVGLYLAMCCFLLTTMLLTADIVARLELSLAIVALFLIGLLTVCLALVAALMETARSFDCLAEDVASR